VEGGGGNGSSLPLHVGLSGGSGGGGKVTSQLDLLQVVEQQLNLLNLVILALMDLETMVVVQDHGFFCS
jgi:hypothetical protein